MSDSTDGKSSANGPGGGAVPRPVSKPPPPPGAIAARPTQRMTADEISAAIVDAQRNREGGGDFENTPVLDPIDDAADGDDAPTADYDPRARIVARAAPSTLVIPTGPSADALRADGTKRRTSRRTVKIPDDMVGRPHPSPSPPKETPSSEPPTMRRPSEPPPRPAAPVAAADAPAPPPEPKADEGFVLRPMRIISIGDDPPPPITSAVAEWPSAQRQKPDSEKPPTSAVETVRKPVDSITKTDMLPPAAIDAIEDGWTPAAPLVSPGLPKIPALAADGAKPPPVETKPPPPEDDDQIDVEVETSENTTDDGDLLEEVEPDAAPIPAKKPPPPPARAKAADAPAVSPPPAPVETEKPKPKPWFEDVFSEDYIKTIDIPPPEYVKREVDFIEESLGIEREGVILDLACGRGEHAIDLALRGYNVVGVDLSPVALGAAHENLKKALALRASKAGAKDTPKEGQKDPPGKPSFLRADMRTLDFEENFDGAYCWATSFGYFDDETNLVVLKKLHRALRQGGMLLIDVANRDFIAPRSPSLVWFEGDGCVCMDDMCVDFLTSRLKVKRTAMFEDGHSRELEYSIRIYSVDALGKLLQMAGFKVVEVTGLIAHPGVFFGSESPRLIVLAERA